MFLAINLTASAIFLFPCRIDIGDRILVAEIFKLAIYWARSLA